MAALPARTRRVMVSEAGLDLVDGSVGGRQDVRFGGFGASEHLRRCGVEWDLLAGAEAGEIDDADGVSVPIGNEAVSEEALGFRFGAGRGGSRGEQQGAPRDQGTVHTDILSPGRVERAPHVMLGKALKPERWPSG